MIDDFGLMILDLRLPIEDWKRGGGAGLEVGDDAFEEEEEEGGGELGMGEGGIGAAARFRGLGHRGGLVDEHQPRAFAVLGRADPFAGVEEQGGEGGDAEHAQQQQGGAALRRQAGRAAPGEPVREDEDQHEERDEEGEW